MLNVVCLSKDLSGLKRKNGGHASRGSTVVSTKCITNVVIRQSEKASLPTLLLFAIAETWI